MQRIYPSEFHIQAEETERFLIIEPPDTQYMGDCANCGGIGYMYYFKMKSGPFKNIPQGHPAHYIEKEGWITGETHGEPCPVCAGNQKQEFLQNISGLNGQDLDIRFDDFKKMDGKQEAKAMGGVILAMSPMPVGLYTYWGGYGVGKTTMLKALTNGFRIAGVPAVYKRMTDILNEVKDTYSNDAKVAAQHLIHNYQNYRAVFIDEVDRIYKTEWSLDTTFTLLDDRYSRQDITLTVLATNADPDELEVDFPYLASRIREGVVIEIGGADVRPALGLKKQMELGDET